MQALGLPVPVKRRRQAEAVEEVPWLQVTLASGGGLAIELWREISGTRARPTGASGALLLAWVADTADAEPATDLGGWSVLGTTTATRTTVPSTALPAGAALDRLWLSAAWIGPRLQIGHLAKPVRVAHVWPGTGPAVNGPLRNPPPIKMPEPTALPLAA